MRGGNRRRLGGMRIGLLLGMIGMLGLHGTALAQTPIVGGFEIRLLPGYTHEQLQGIDSIVGKIVGKNGVDVHYEIGVITKGPFRVGGEFSNAALRTAENDRQWLKEQTIQGHTFQIAYLKDQTLIISSNRGNRGVNFVTKAKDPGTLADLLLMTLSFTEKPAERK
ncbi:hypothetical protein [Tuwongella immobilis]|uniref:Uncharacterized protein n=1 Tax=Tuwongella immobilis TaxID=692036 RepID=A0A6C2YIL0_9BACT|nr:hypothetical protein [Tuwongella immobilis]VIP01089.1 unnamed protein product [Tuwongella immobilis]VTR97603.1 unnamed protein product [Tuwongella immobilis]